MPFPGFSLRPRYLRAYIQPGVWMPLQGPFIHALFLFCFPSPSCLTCSFAAPVKKEAEDGDRREIEAGKAEWGERRDKQLLLSTQG